MHRNKMADFRFPLGDNMGLADVESQQFKMGQLNDPVSWEEVERCIERDDNKELDKIIQKKGFESVWRPLNAPGNFTPLHKAAELGNTACMKLLIETCNHHGSSIDNPDCEGNTPLFIAVKSAQIESVKELLSSNAHVNARNDLGHSILHVISYSLSSSKDKVTQDKLIECLDLILERPDIDLEAHNKTGFTPLLSAAKKVPSDEGMRRSNNLVLFCRKLLSKGASLEACDKRGLCVRKVLEERSALPAVLMGKEVKSSPQRPFSSLLLDSLILGAEGDHVSELLVGQPQEEAHRASNCYIGSQTVLFFVVDKCKIKAVESLLEVGADPWEPQLSGELCLHRSLSRGNPEILDLLINYMKKKKNLHRLDVSYQSYSLLENLLENHKKVSKSSGESMHLKCLKRMLEDDIILNINERSTGGVSQSILHIAASFNNQEALRLLLEKGAFIGSRKTVVGEDRGNILPALRTKTLEYAMDGCISCLKSEDDIEESNTENIISPDYTLNLNYKFLIPPSENESRDEVSGRNEVKTLVEIGAERQHRKILKHPLIQTLLYAKWRKVLPLYIMNLSLYLGFVIVLTLFMYNLKDLRVLEERSSRLTVSNATIEEDISSYSSTVYTYMALVIPLMLYMLIREIFQIIYTRRTYLKNFENFLEWFLIIIVIVLCSASLGVETTRHLAAWAMIIAWYEFVLLLGRAPPLAIYVTMLRHVSFNFLKLIILYAALIVAFTVSFNIILQPTTLSEESDTEFGNFWTTLPKSIVMATGEFEYSDLSSNFLTSRVIFATSAILIFLVFLFLIFLVLMNVMNGLAVTDTQQVMDEATLYSLKSRLELIYLIEEMLLVIPFLKKYLSKIHVISPYKPPNLLVKVNYPEKNKRIIYGGRKHEFCKLDNDTAHILRSYRQQLLTEKEERERLDPATECLSLLQELRDLSYQNQRMQSPVTMSPSSSRGRLN